MNQISTPARELLKKQIIRITGNHLTHDLISVTPEQWHHMVAEAAYYRALRRDSNGNGGNEDSTGDWLAAETEIKASFQIAETM